VDGDPHSSWWADQREDDPQWLMVDLGSVRQVGAVSVLWWKAYAADYKRLTQLCREHQMGLGRSLVDRLATVRDKRKRRGLESQVIRER
jgi:hypothetical protein